MNDLRQGVTPAQHDLLDHMEQQAAIMLAEGDWGGDIDERLLTARAFAKVASSNASLATKRAAAISAAAILVDCADALGLLIGEVPA